MFARLERHPTPARPAGLLALLLALAALPLPAQPQPSGAEAWAANCGRCHRPRNVDAYNAWQWQSVTTHMALVARLTPDETQAIREFLVRGPTAQVGAPGDAAALPQSQAVLLASAAPAAPPCCDLAVGKQLFDKQCVACHGKGGKGDGPAAVALNPRPSNLTDQERMKTVIDDSLFQVIANGRKGMPPYAKALTAEQLHELVFYIRSLKP